MALEQKQLEIGKMDVINFEEKRHQREMVEIDKDQERWEHARSRFVEVLQTSPLPYTTLVSAGLRAMIDALTLGDNMSLDQAKIEISNRLKCFFERNESVVESL